MTLTEYITYQCRIVMKRKRELMRGPKVIIDDRTLNVFIAQWFGVIPATTILKSLKEQDSSLLNTERMLKYKDFLNEDYSSELRSGNEQISQFLKTIGIQKSEVCTLEKTNDMNLGFRCRFSGTRKPAKIMLCNDDMNEDGPSVYVKQKDALKKYHYVFENGRYAFKLRKYEKVNQNSNILYFHKETKTGLRIEYFSKNHQIFINFEFDPKDIEFFDFQNHEDLITSLESAKDPRDVYQLLKGFSLQPLENCVHYSILLQLHNYQFNDFNMMPLKYKNPMYVNNKDERIKK